MWQKITKKVQQLGNEIGRQRKYIHSHTQSHTHANKYSFFDFFFFFCFCLFLRLIDQLSPIILQHKIHDSDKDEDEDDDDDVVVVDDTTDANDGMIKQKTQNEINAKRYHAAVFSKTAAAVARNKQKIIIINTPSPKKKYIRIYENEKTLKAMNSIRDLASIFKNR